MHVHLFARCALECMHVQYVKSGEQQGSEVQVVCTRDGDTRVGTASIEV